MFDSLSTLGTLLKQIISHFHFIRPLWLSLLIPFTSILYIKWHQDTKRNNKNQLPEHLHRVLLIDESSWKKQLPLKLLFVVIFLSILICAGPTWQKQPSPFGEDKAPLLIVLDTSNSMLEKDVLPTRLIRAKQKIQDLIALRDGGKTGLIVYSGTAHLAMPLTQDSAVITPYLAAIEPKIMPIEGKSAYKTIPLIKQQFSTLSKNNQPLRGTVILLTDGVTTSDNQAFEDYFSHSSNQLLILAVGDSNQSSDFPLNMDSLNELNQLSHGHITQITIDNNDVIWLNNQIERHMQLSNDSVMPWEDIGYYLLIPVLFLLLLWFRRGWLVQWCAALVLVSSIGLYSPISMAKMVQSTSAPNELNTNNKQTLWVQTTQWWMDLWLTPDQQGQWYFDRNEYAKAAQHYQNPLHKGVAFYYAAQYQQAYTAFMAGIPDLQNALEENRSVNTQDKIDNQKNIDVLLFNTANALARQREYLAARDLFQAIVNRSPYNKAAQHNLTLIQNIIDEINRLSESQANTGEVEQSQDLPDDEPQTADGADEQVLESQIIKQTLSAEQILANEKVAEKWLRRVEAAPKYFLQNKFHMQTLSDKGNK
ncbi:VWA domain-containing protein [Aliivibrio fischeri]|uniref:vWA domain-containing protein n=1 Tax=Aliivibrio fischeri TaxID=668 RepID=UPI0012D9AB3A|nr:VWA domain-containing protein [Aliivibrio fischeri]MUK61739.1 VWA domain-containing protein [Aliivibrio fischeri]MUL21990.1 VWA domain-containing protein [Aliivibrio fischeri]MUL25795.1 VWA domain-containing protein [Aliivibrio fischeri]